MTGITIDSDHPFIIPANWPRPPYLVIILTPGDGIVKVPGCDTLAEVHHALSEVGPNQQCVTLKHTTGRTYIVMDQSELLM